MLPIFLYRKLVLGKKTPLIKKFFVPKLQSSLKQPVVWVHAVSLGEMKVAASLIEALQKEVKFDLVITTQTETGFEFAKKTFQKNVFYFPFDFQYLQKKWIHQIQPTLFLLVESDFWLNSLKILRERNVPVCLINGKISERSFKRYSFFKSLASKIFSNFDFLFVQDFEIKEKFLKFIPTGKIEVTANLKLFKPVHCKKGDFPHLENQKVIIISCTHYNEEKELFNALKSLLDHGFVLIFAPRHPERFSLVFEMLKQLEPDTSQITEMKLTKCIVVNQMGILGEIYCYSEFCVMGGTYGSKLGGHDIFEPILAGVYTFFGPYMQAQRQLKKMALQFDLGQSCESHLLADEILKKNRIPIFKSENQKKIEAIKSSLRSSFERVLSVLKKIISEEI